MENVVSRGSRHTLLAAIAYHVAASLLVLSLISPLTVRAYGLGIYTPPDGMTVSPSNGAGGTATSQPTGGTNPESQHGLGIYTSPATTTPMPTSGVERTATSQPIKLSVFTRTLGFSARGNDVKSLQILLGVPQTGYFGPMTSVALVVFQRAHGITPASGIFGPKTRAALGM